MQSKSGADIPDAYVVYDAALRNQSRKLEIEHTERYEHECSNKGRYLVRPDGTVCDDMPEPINPHFIEEYIEIERRQAMLVAGHIACQAIEDPQIPVLYAPDGAIHVAMGIIDGLAQEGVTGHLFPVDRNEPIPEHAADIALTTRQALFCDSVMNLGKVSAGILRRLPSSNDTSTRIITYFSHATALDMPDNGVLRDDRRPLKGMPRLQRATKAAGYQYHCYVTDIGAGKADIFDRADAIAYAASHGPALLDYVYMFLKPEVHNALHLVR
jgi:hypothetical protein